MNLGEAFRPAPPPDVIYCCLEHLKFWNWPDLSAPHWRWYWNDQTGANIVVGNERWSLGPDRIILIPPQTSFASSTARPVKHFYIHFTLSWTYKPVAKQPLVRAPSQAEIRLIRDYEEALKLPSPARQWEISRIAHTLVSLSLASLPRDALHNPGLDPRMVDALRLMRDRYPDVVDNRTLAAAARLSVSAFIRLFQELMDETPRQYQMHQRIRDACTLLHQADLSIEEIADRTGFCDRYYFSRIFRQIQRTSPVEFRKRTILSSA